ncbi:AI-2E family transporter [Herbaspirillum huttiense]|jgi:Predicted permease|uniref:AI-2E family transporter n=3 Tax=Herbaspirillum huttiense TaxID=863372 RepID=A0AAJ2H3P3_9BURK|nr:MULTISPECIES: AI-2E family transporter [Herbaspirillum]MBP1314909.1 putative PurR-regulated permease PerM [Herbaspirillum sp. 1130]MDR6742079.1 putative PurR-regulated permease PerM [Herbaspirillum sp. 1173]MDR9836047.1 AI-2E family transporter [Herbaspirillum huttiense]MDR9850515.1 AI-2E family transporter [Herbaspirillum huttiense SE1]MDT0357792.1 AI-2E family transporter [Herbaspirillum huttiense F1]
MQNLKTSAFSRLSSTTLLGAAVVLGMLYFGRDILAPLAVAGIASLIILPLVRKLDALGLNRAAAAMVSVLLVGGCLVALAVVLTFQLVSVTSDLPQYREGIQDKVESVRAMAERPFARLEAELSAVIPQPVPESARSGKKNSRTAAAAAAAAATPEADTRMSVRGALRRLFALAWGPIGQAGIVLVLLVFILLEQESLRERLIRLAGLTEMSRTMQALGDAAEGVSRFFFSQFVVNLVFGLIMGAVLAAGGVPHAVLWGALAGVLRFVPYLGALASGLMISVFIAAIDPGWWLALSFLAFYVGLEVIVANFIEPRVYGHSSGLSPLAVIVSALFWGTLWGPIGLLLSTPLTLCLVVAGRHVAALEPITILLGEAPDMTHAERFYQRALAGESEAIIRDARGHLQKQSFAKYCDQILLPGLALAALDLRHGRIEGAQQERLLHSVSQLTEVLTQSPGAPRSLRRRREVPLLNSGVGAHLRELRQARLGRWQGSLDVPQGSVVLCGGLRGERDDLLSELLVHALRVTGIDARSITLDQPEEEQPDTSKAELVSIVFLVYPVREKLEAWMAVVHDLRENLPHALLVTIRPSFFNEEVEATTVKEQVDMVLSSFEEGLAFASTHMRPAIKA